MSRRSIFIVMAALIAASCSSRMDDSVPAGAVALGEIQTKASTPTSAVGRQFIEGDQFLVTHMSRTANPIGAMTYSGIEFTLGPSGWSRSDTPASTPTNHPDRIYWSDSVNDHTFIGYSIPQNPGFVWSDNQGIYSGVIGGNAEGTSVDFTSAEKIAQEDILLLRNTQQKAGVTGEAILDFYHGLSLVRVIVDITDYSSLALDRTVTISDLTLKDMPTRYTWDQNTAGVTAVAIGNPAKDFLTWQPVATEAEFFSLAVPGTTSFVMPFKVHYTDPLDEVTPRESEYQASISGVELIAGKCTTITINLSHEGEPITIGASHQDWEFIETPDKGELMKNVTFLEGSSTKTPEVTIASQPEATKDDATWLFIDPATSTLKDIYNNDGTQANPFKIATAAQLLSFAGEVTSGRTFEGKYIKLDASLTLQRVGYDGTSPFSWPGIGNSTCAFNGYFDGGGRTISLLYGSPLFIGLGENARVEHLALVSVLGGASASTGASKAALANTNAGTVCALRVEGTTTAAVESNTGLIFASGIVSTTSADGCHLVSSSNTGWIRASFSAGTSKGYMYAGAGAVNESVEATIAESEAMDKKDMIKESFVTTMNDAITAARANDSSLDNHNFTVVAGNYPVIQ